MIEQMKELIKRVQKYRFSDEKSKENEMEEEQIYNQFLEKVEKIPDISYVNLAKKAIKFRNEKLSMKLLDQEKSALTKIPQLLELKKLRHSLDICFKTYDFNIVSIVIQKLPNNISFTDIILDFLKKPEYQCHLPQILLYYKRYKQDELSKFLSDSKNYNHLLYLKLEELFNEENPANKQNILTECIKCNKDGNLKYKKYLDVLNNSMTLQEECIKNGYISNTGKDQTDGTVYDCYSKAIKKFEYAFVERQNKNLEYSSKRLNLLKFRALIEDKKLQDVDEILERTPLKKLGLTPLNMAEIYYDYKIYDRASEYLMQVKEVNYLFYVVDLLKNMGENKKALEIVISNKDFEMKEIQINEILKKDPTLKEYVDELCVKYKVNI